MNDNFKKILEANYNYSKDFGNKSEFNAPPKRKIAILTCMDARLDPAKFAGLEEGDAHVIRNAGGRTSDDAIRSLVISYKLLGTNEWYVIHHTDCGMSLFTNEIMGNLLSSSLETAEISDNGWVDVGKGPGSEAGKKIDWLTFKDPKASVLDDIIKIKNHPLVPDNIPVYGLLFDVKTGTLIEVEEVSKVGATA
ncbi:MAG: beta-class carbonic anhydrase [Thermodesulfobacteriota bacterium]